MKARALFRVLLLDGPVVAACLTGGTALGAGAANDPGLPKPVPAERYAALAAVSPFAPPTAAPAVAPQAPPPPQPSWAEAWTLSSVAELGAGQYRLTLTKRKAGDGKGNDRVVVTSGQENSENIAIAGVQWSDKPEQTRITLNRSGVFAVFTFDPGSLLAQPNSGGAAMPGKPPGVLGSPGSMVPQPLTRPGMPSPGQTAPPVPGMEQTLQVPPTLPPGIVPPTMPPHAEVPQRAGSRTGPIPAAPPPPVPPPRAFRPPVDTPAVRQLQGLAGAEDEDTL